MAERAGRTSAAGAGLSFRCEIARRGEEVTVAPVGELDIASCPQLEAHLDRICAEPIGRLILDLTLTTFMDTTAVRLILARHLLAQTAGWTFTVIAGDGQARRVLDVAGATATLDLRESS